MKKIVTFALTAALALAGTAAAAQDTDYALVNQTAQVKLFDDVKSDTYKLVFLRNTDEKVWVRIKDAWGRELLKEEVPSDRSFARPYNFSSLAAGQYAIEVSNGSEYYNLRVNHTPAGYLTEAK